MKDLIVYLIVSVLYTLGYIGAYNLGKHTAKQRLWKLITLWHRRGRQNTDLQKNVFDPFFDK